MKRLPLGLPLFLVVFAGLAIAQSPEPEQIDSAKTASPIKITIGTFSTEGLKPEVADATLTAIIDKLTTMRAIVTPDPREEAVIDGGCFSEPACLRSLCKKLGVVGVLEIKVNRLGPQVRIAAKLYSAESGQVVSEKTATASAAEFSESSVLVDVLTAVMKPLGLTQPEPDSQELAVATSEGLPPAPVANKTLVESGKKPFEQEVKSRPVVILDSGPGPEPAAASSLRTWGWVSLGVAGALLVSGAATGGLSLSLDRDLENECGGRTCPPGHESEINRIDNLAMATNVLLGVGAAATLAGILILAICDDDPFSGDGIELRPSVGSGFAGAEVFGRF
ncbi:MAG: hypothetical protein JRJ87_00245 [Deltaproteobacteria bacterium]|nr:hypothetical protein [Deltaproteobacteria bacterium]